MRCKQFIREKWAKPLLGVVFAFLTLFSHFTAPVNAISQGSSNIVNSTSQIATIDPLENLIADNKTDDTKEEDKDKKDKKEEETNTCYNHIGTLGWIVCPAASLLATITDAIYNAIGDLLAVQPVTSENSDPMYIVWGYARGIANIFFIFFLLIVIYSQLTGVGLNSYGIKKTLPRIIIAAILVNLSFLICQLAVDASNIVGASIRGIFTSAEEAAMSAGAISPDAKVPIAQILTAIAAGGAIGGFAIGLSGGVSALLISLVPVILGAVLSVLVGIIMLGVRQAAVFLLVMVSPLAFVCYLLPNTEKWFTKWRQYLQQMLVFYPLFSLLLGASQLAGYIIITNGVKLENGFFVLLGLAVQYYPLFLAFRLMKLSGTFLGGLSNKLSNLGEKAKGAVGSRARAEADAKRAAHLARNMKKGLNPMAGGNPFNVMSGGYWRARAAQRNALLQDRTKTDLDTAAQITQQRINAAKLGQRVAGYRKDGSVIYSQLPIDKPILGKFASQDMEREIRNREARLRGQGKAMEMDNAMNTMGTYAEEHGIKNQAIKNLAHQQGENYLELRTQMAAKRLNDRADERFYFNTIQEAAKNTTTKQKADYQKYVVRGAGSDFYDKIPGTSRINQKTRTDALSSVIADAYDAQEAQRKLTTQKYTTFFGKQVTDNVLKHYDEMLKNNNIDGIIAAQNTLAMRGDYDAIGARLSDYMDKGNVKLTTDEANMLALNLLGMKNSDPTLGRLGKFINMETWRYTSGERKTQEITMKEFFTGEISNEIGADNQPYKTKINIATGLQGTSLKGIDRTAFADLINLSEKYLSGKDAASKKMMADLEVAIMPQIVSALPTFDSGSEQITNTVAWLTGNKNKDGKWINSRDKNSATYAEDTNTYLKRTSTYLSALTPNDLINLKSDTFTSVMLLFQDYYGDQAQAEFRKIFSDGEEWGAGIFGQNPNGTWVTKKGNGNISKLMGGNFSAMNPMKDPVRKALGIPSVRPQHGPSPEDNS